MRYSIRISFLAIFILGTCNTFSQSQKEMEIVLASETSTIDQKIFAHHSIIKQQIGKEPDSVVAILYSQLTGLYNKSQKFDSAFYTIDEAILKLKKLTLKDKLKLQQYRAQIYSEKGEPENQLKALLEILRKYEKYKMHEECIKLNQRIGSIFERNDDLKNALFYLDEALNLAVKIKNNNLISSVLMNLGNIEKTQRNFAQAQKHYFRSIEISKKEGDKRNLAGNYNNLASSYRMEKKFEFAKKYYNLAVKINLEIGNKAWLAYNYNNLGNVSNDLGNFQEGLVFFNKSMEMKEELGDRESMVQTFQNISESYAGLGNHKKAYDALLQFNKLNDSLINVRRSEEAQKISAQFQSEKRIAEIKELNLKNELNIKEIKARDDRISYQKFLSWLMGVGIFLVITILVILLVSVRNRKKATLILSEKNERIASQHKEIIDSINYAKRIQSTILPSWNKVTDLLPSSAILFKPKDIVSGDFYLCEETENGTYFGVVDCTGHGVPGAMVSLVASNHINKALIELSSVLPEDILNELNKTIPNALASSDSSINDGMDVGLCFLPKNSDKLHFSGAQLDCWVLNTNERIQERFKGSEIVTNTEFGLAKLNGNRRGIGRTYSEGLFNGSSFKLEKGDKIILTSDGYSDQFGGPSNKKFKIKEMRRVLLENGDQDCLTISAKLNDELVKWQGNHEQIDDVCVFLVEIR